jgi:hypothetical protein
MRGQAHQAMDFDPDQFTEAVFAFGRLMGGSGWRSPRPGAESP